MTRWRAWISSALASTEREVADVHPGPSPEIRALCADLTGSTEEELTVFQRRFDPARQTPRPLVPAWTAAPAFALALLAAFMLWPSGPIAYPAPDLPLGAVVQLDSGEREQLGPSITMDGLGVVEVLKAGPGGTEITLHDGVARFDVDPAGPFRHLVIHAADVEVEVKGTRFEVHTFEGLVHVRVERGTVQVRRDGLVALVQGGDRWSSVDAVATRSLTPPPSRTESRPVASRVDKPVAAPPPPPVKPGAPVAPADSVVQTIAAKTPSEVALEYNAIFQARKAGAPADELYERLTAFLVENQGSVIAPEARALRLEIAAEVKPPRDVISHIDLFLAVYPNHIKRLSLLEARATLQRDKLHDCAAALPTYRTLAEEAQGPRRARAFAWRGICAAEQGHTAEAREALRTAIDLDVEEPLRAEAAAMQEKLADAR